VFERKNAGALLVSESYSEMNTFAQGRAKDSALLREREQIPGVLEKEQSRDATQSRKITSIIHSNKTLWEEHEVAQLGWETTR